jgi:hypothetical protein
MTPDSSFTPADVGKLTIEFAGSDLGHKVRVRKYKEARVVLDAFENSAVTLLAVRRAIQPRR